MLIENYENLTPREKTHQKSMLEERLRTSAHGMEFAALGMSCAAFALTFLTAFKGKKAALLPLFAFVFCVLYALSDEIHQTFVPGRAFQTADILMDCVGALTGILLVSLPVLIGVSMRTRKGEKKKEADPSPVEEQEEQAF